MLGTIKKFLFKPKDRQQKIRRKNSYQDHLYHNESNSNSAYKQVEYKRSICLVIILLLMLLISFLLWMIKPVIADKQEMIVDLLRDQTNTNVAILQNLAKTHELKQMMEQQQKEYLDSSESKQYLIKIVEARVITLEKNIQEIQGKQVKLGVKDYNLQKEQQKTLAEIFRAREKLVLLKKQISLMQRPPQSHKFYEQVSENHIFSIPKNIWIWREKPQTYLKARYFQNIKYYSQANDFHLRFIDQNSIDTYLPAHDADILYNILTILEKQVKGQLLQSLKRLLILLNFLNIHGGIMINGYFGFTENLSWISSILTNKIVNRGNKYAKPQVIGFYNPKYAEDKKKFNIKPYEGMEQVDRYITEFPALQQIFLASIKRPQYLGLVIQKVYLYIKDNQNFKASKVEYGLKDIRYGQIYRQIFFAACSTILIDKQRQIDSYLKDEYKQFAFDYYGLNLINAYYGPFKMDMIYEGNYFIISRAPQLSHHRVYHDMCRYSYQEYITYIGPVKYIYMITYQNFMNKYLEKTSKGEDIEIYEGSFLQKFLYPQDKHFFIVKNPEKTFINDTNTPWNIQKNIWVYWDNGIVNAPIFVQLCVANMRESAKSSGFEFIQLNDTNLQNYIQEQYLNRIQYSFQHAKVVTMIQTKSDLYRLAVLILNGGIYLDSNTITVQNFDWLVNIGKFPSQYLFNRFGENPQTLMTWHPYVGQPQQWNFYQLDYNRNIKHQWFQSLENSFIAAEKGSEFLTDWFDMFLQLLLHPYSEIESIFQQNGVFKHKSTSPTFHYLLAMDTAKCVLGKKQKAILQDPNSQWINANHFYKLWTFNTFISPFKLWNKSNYQNPARQLSGQSMPFLYRYSIQYIEGIIGPLRFIVKQFKQQTQFMNDFIKSHLDGNFTSEAHSRSFFMKFLWRESYRIIQIQSNKLQLLAHS